MCSNMIFNNSPDIIYDKFSNIYILKFIFANIYYEFAIDEKDNIDDILNKLTKITNFNKTCPICFEYRESYQICHDCSNSVCSKCFISILNDSGIYNCPFCRVKYSFGLTHPDQLQEVKKILSNTFK